MVDIGDVLYALYGATSGDVSISKTNGSINQAVLCIRSKKTNFNFLEQLLKYSKNNILIIYLQGGQGNLSATIIKDLNYLIPQIEEQQKIANFLSILDKKLEKKQEKLDYLNQWKKGLLQQMFV